MSGKTEKNPRLGTVGGQAVMEGVMMKSKDSVAIAVRRENGEIVKKVKDYKALKDRHKILNIPFLRGFINFIDMMKLAMGTLTESVEMLGLDEEPEPPETKDDELKVEKSYKETGKSEPEEPEETKKPKEKEKTSAMITAASIIGIVLGLALSFGLFFFLPTFLGSTIETVFADKLGVEVIPPAALSMFEGVMRLLIFLGYILLVSQMKDIRRTFEYHGAEHMSIFAYENGEELSVESARKYSRFHPRCGTSFLIIMILLGFIIGMIIPRGLWFRVLIRLALFPIVIGVAYEFIKLAGKHSDNIFVKIISAPGMWVQRLTTKKPDDAQLEVAAAALKLALKLEKPPEEPGENTENTENTENEENTETANE
ncbi:MAG: DUF1385 domain-containing protein [Oscillospiraceae bacterium]|nr:DUF1385 domain-containing protein [Oscillospiraceae bacterium]